MVPICWNIIQVFAPGVTPWMWIHGNASGFQSIMGTVVTKLKPVVKAKATADLC